ncbi:MAG: arginine--tRNA ligase, partial [Pirellulales bacterium]
AADIVAQLEIDDLCEPPEIAGPGFINLRIKNSVLLARLEAARRDPRLAIPRVEAPRTFVVDYSAPNVAKPMHVGHIRSTVIGDALVHTLRFLGHSVQGDNHIGDWGTQFGMILYGYKHFLDQPAFAASPVAELARLYRVVSGMVSHVKLKQTLPQLREKVQRQEALVNDLPADPPPNDKKAAKALAKAQRQLQELEKELREAEQAIERAESDREFAARLAAHPDVARAVLAETSMLHAGDQVNLSLWRQFLPACLEDIDRVYRRIGVTFDHTLGESFYHDRLAGVVDDLLAKGIAQESDGAVCVFFDDGDVPMIVRKQDGAYLYATTDLATIQYRMETWRPAAILYVVDHRQSLHFTHLFETARRWGYDDVELQHVKFGTVLGEDGRPFKTRSGDTVGLEGLLDEAIDKALAVVSANDDAKPAGPELSIDERRQIADVVGIAALKYADLSHNRESDYVFSFEKMVAMQGNTATYMQYAYARVRAIFRKGDVDVEQLRGGDAAVALGAAAERALALRLLQFGEALDSVAADYRPNHLTNYLFELAEAFSTFYNECPVLKAESPAQRESRLLLADLTGRTIQQGLQLLGIEVVEQM